MRNGALPTWVYVLVAAAIASIGFGLGQMAQGAGITFVLLATMVWMAWSIRRHERRVKTDG